MMYQSVRKMNEAEDIEECFIKLWLTYFQSVFLNGTDMRHDAANFRILCNKGGPDFGGIDNYDMWRDIYTTYDVVFDAERLKDDLSQIAYLAIVPFPYFQLRSNRQGEYYVSPACCYKVRATNGAIITRKSVQVKKNILDKPEQLKVNILRFAKWHGQGQQCLRALHKVMVMVSNVDNSFENTPIEADTVSAKMCVPSMGERVWRGDDITLDYSGQDVHLAKTIVSLLMMGRRLDGYFEDIISLQGWRTEIVVDAGGDGLAEAANSIGLLEEDGMRRCSAKLCMAEGVFDAIPVVSHILTKKIATMIRHGVMAHGVKRSPVLCGAHIFTNAWSAAYEEEVTIDDDTLYISKERMYSLDEKSRMAKRARAIRGRNIINSWFNSSKTASKIEMAMSSEMLELKPEFREIEELMRGGTYKAHLTSIHVAVTKVDNYENDSLFNRNPTRGEFETNVTSGPWTENVLDTVAMPRAEPPPPEVKSSERTAELAHLFPNAEGDLQQQGASVSSVDPVVGGAGRDPFFKYKPVPAVVGAGKAATMCAPTPADVDMVIRTWNNRPSFDGYWREVQSPVRDIKRTVAWLTSILAQGSEVVEGEFVLTPPRKEEEGTAGSSAPVEKGVPTLAKPAQANTPSLVADGTEHCDDIEADTSAVGGNDGSGEPGAVTGGSSVSWADLCDSGDEEEVYGLTKVPATYGGTAVSDVIDPRAFQPRKGATSGRKKTTTQGNTGHSRGCVPDRGRKRSTSPKYWRTGMRPRGTCPW
jgi:hypothetical protein